MTGTDPPFLLKKQKQEDLPSGFESLSSGPRSETWNDWAVTLLLCVGFLGGGLDLSPRCQPGQRAGSASPRTRMGLHGSIRGGKRILCSVVPARSLDSVTWQEGKGPVKGDVQSFWGDGATLLLVCPGEGLPEPRARKPGIIRCLVPQNKGISFSLAGELSDNKGREFCLQHIPYC